MCCLVGASGTLHKDELEAFKQLLLIGALRGPHSTGVAKVERATKEISVYKRAVNPYEFVDSHQYDRVVGFGSSVLIGHNRWATIGKINHLNAHPFDFPRIVGAHNGTLSTKYDLEKHADYGTDSEALYFNIDKYGPEQVIPEMKGAWALTWYDKEENTINMLRNKERTLFFVFSQDNKALFWASEARMLSFVLTRCGIKFDKIFSVGEDTMLTYEVPPAGGAFKRDQLQRKTIKGKKEIYTGHHNNYYESVFPIAQREVAKQSSRPLLENSSSNSTKNTGPVTNSHSMIGNRIPPKRQAGELTHEYRERLRKFYAEKHIIDTVAKDVTPKSGTDIQFYGHADNDTKLPVYKGFRGKELTRPEFEKATQDGCIYCGTNVAWGETVRFTSESEFLCTDHMSMANWAV